MLGDNERSQVKDRENQILKKVAKDLLTLKKIDPIYAKKILQIFTYPHNAGNNSYVSKILKNSEKLGISTHMRDDLYRFGETQTKKNVRSAAKADNISAIFITNPIAAKIYGERYQEIVNLTGTKDIDG